MVGRSCGVGHGQEGDEESPPQERNVQELVIDDMQRQIKELTHRLEERDL